MSNYIEFYYDDNTYVAEIHKDNKYCRIRNKNNIKVLKELLAKKKIYTGGNTTTIKDVDDVIKAFDKHMEMLKRLDNVKKKPLKILNKITTDMKVSKKNVTIGKTVVVASLATVIGFSAIAMANKNDTEEEIIVPEESIVYLVQEEKPLPTIVPRNEEELKPSIDTDELLEVAKEYEEKQIEETSEVKEELNSMLIEEESSEFHFSYDDRSNSSNVERTKKYEDIFEKYAKMYGLDKDLLIAIASQESAGKHYENLPSGSAFGIMQIENVNLNSTIKAYNFNEGKIEKFHVTRAGVEDLDTNIKIGAMMLRERIDTYDNNIPLAIQSYNYGSGNLSKVLKMCVKNEGITKSNIINSPLYQEWMKYRSKAVKNGDSKYVEHVFSYLPHNHVIKIKDRTGNNIKMITINDNIKVNQMA